MSFALPFPILGKVSEWQIESIFQGEARIEETRRQHTDDLERSSFDLQDLAQYTVAASIATLPKTMVQHCDRLGTRLVRFVAEESAQKRFHPEHRKQIGCRVDSKNRLGTVSTGESDGVIGVCGQRLEGAVAPLPVEVVVPAQPMRILDDRLHHIDQAVGYSKGKGIEDDAAGYGGQSGGRADAKS